jgi:hypothetical protein
VAGHDADAFRAWLPKREVEAVTLDASSHAAVLIRSGGRRRNLIERMFCRTKDSV